MTERVFVRGNEAVGWGALMADCQAFFGYPITPQNEIIEFFARELPKRGGVFVQSQSELGAIHQVYGAAASGARVITSTSSPGWSLMLEGLSHITTAEVPCVVVLVQRGGPGLGNARHSQLDYLSATRGSHGGYKTVVLAPHSVQETHDLIQLAFHVADKYRNPVILLTDAIVGQMAEPLEIKPLHFGDLPAKDWTIVGKGHHSDDERRVTHLNPGLYALDPYPNYGAFMAKWSAKHDTMRANEGRWERCLCDDAELVIVAYGYVSRTARAAMHRARAEGLKVGLIRPISLWPFPSEVIHDAAKAGAQILVAEDSLGQMLDDVHIATAGVSHVHFLGMLARHNPSDSGALYPGRILAEVKRILKGDANG